MKYYEVLKPITLGYGSHTREPTPKKHKTFSPGDVLTLNSEAADGTVWFIDADGDRGKIDCGEAMNLVRDRVLSILRRLGPGEESGSYAKQFTFQHGGYMKTFNANTYQEALEALIAHAGTEARASRWSYFQLHDLRPDVSVRGQRPGHRGGLTLRNDFKKESHKNYIRKKHETHIRTPRDL